MWLKAGHVAGYDFQPLILDPQDCREADAMENCLRSYGYNWRIIIPGSGAVRREGERVATLRIGCRYRDPLLTSSSSRALAMPPRLASFGGARANGSTCTTCRRSKSGNVTGTQHRLTAPRGCRFGDRIGSENAASRNGYRSHRSRDALKAL